MKNFLLFIFLFIFEIAFAQNQREQKILVKVGDKEISVAEFLQRSELTIRPGNFKGKNTTLNNLISEKILALEAEKNIRLMQNLVLHSGLKGIKEQLMRDKLYDEEAFNNVELDTSEIKNAFRLSIREYELEFYTINNKEMIRQIETIIDSVPELTNDLFKELKTITGKKPVHNVKYFDPEDEIIHEALYTNLLDTGTVVGPVKISNSDYIFMKVLKWVDYPILSGVDQQERWNKVKEKMHLAKANKLWRSYILNVMKGKKIEFDKETFKFLSEISFEYFIKNNQSDSLNLRISEIPLREEEINSSAPFFTIDGKVWSVEDFKKELMSHPLVFRTKDINKNNYNEQFKLAIVDMIRDHYLTGEAYKKSLDKSEEINKTVQMWNDSYLAAELKKDVIDSALEKGIINIDDNSGMLRYWESYLTGLQDKYSDSIWINFNELNKTSLTNIDFFAMRPGVPYPVPVPSFPMLISSENLDYVKQEKQN